MASGGGGLSDYNKGIWKRIKQAVYPTYRSDYSSHIYPSEYEPTMYDLYLWLLHDIEYAAAVEQYTDMCVGSGYFISHNGKSQMAHSAADYIEKLMKEVNLEQWLYDTSVNAWAFGNSFSIKVYEDDKLMKLPMVPVASIVDIKTNELNEPIMYTQDPQYYHRSRYTDDPNLYQQRLITHDAKDIMHFSIRRLNASPWGTGLGQIQARTGRGYRINNNKEKRAQSLFRTREMFRDVQSHIWYNMQPRYIVKTKGPKSVQGVMEAMSQSDPGTIVVSEGIEDASTVSGDTSGKFGDMLSMQDKQASLANMSGYSRILDPSQTSYSASEVTADSQLPFVEQYRKRLKNYVEQEIIRPEIETMYGDGHWHKFEIELNWGKQDKMTADEYVKLIRVLNEAEPLKERIDWDDLIEQMQDNGIQIKTLERAKRQMVKPSKSQNNNREKENNNNNMSK